MGFLLAESLTRLFLRYNTPDTVRQHSLQYLPSVFGRHRLKPDQAVSTSGAWGDPANPDGSGRTFTINERGYRGVPITIPKPESTIRIVVLGGSSVFDVNANEGADWPHLVQEFLRHSGHPEVEVINAGVPGHASFDSLGRLYSQLWMFEPDYVVLYHGWNDVKYFPSLDPGHPLIAKLTPYDPAADPFQNYRGGLDRFLAHSQVYIKLRSQYWIHKLDPGTEGARIEAGVQAGYGPWGLRQFQLDVELLIEATRAIQATPLLVTESTLVVAANTPDERARIHYEYQGMGHDALVRALQDCARIVRQVGHEKNVDVLDLAGRFNGRGDLFEDHVHTTAAGSRAIAAEVAAFVAKVMTRTHP